MIHVHGNPNTNGISDSTGWKLHFDPIDNSPKTMDAIESHLRDTVKVQFKGGRSNNHGPGKSYTAYPQSLEERDRVITALENKDTGISHLLAPANPVEGNVQFSGSTTGRFTTGYNHTDPVTGEVNWGKTTKLNEGTEALAAQERGGINQYIKDSWNVTGENKNSWLPLRTTEAEVAEDITALKANHPAVHELMVGKPGYNSPYPLHLPGVVNTPTPQAAPDNTVTAAGRKRTMVLANYDKMSDDDLLRHYEGAKANYEKQLIIDPEGKGFLPTARGSLEGTEKQLRARGIHPDQTAPASVATANATKVTPLADEYDTGTVAAKISAGEPVTAPPPVSPSPTPRGPTIGTPTNVTTGASAEGPRAGKPIEPAGAARVDTTLISDAEKATMSGVKGGEGISVVDAGLGATIKSNPGLTAREAIGTIGKEIKTFTKAQGKVDRKIAGHELSSAVAAGFKESKNLRLLGLGALVGVGYGASRVMHHNNKDLQR